jgi:perosamine synthetase
MPMYQTRFELHRVAEMLGWRGMNLPSWPGLTDTQLDRICDTIRAFFENRTAQA